MVVGSVEGSGGEGGSGVGGGVDDGSGLDLAGDSGMGDMVGVGHDSGGDALLDDGLASDGNRDGHVVGSVNVDGVGHRDDVVLVDGSVIGDGDLALNQDGGLHVVDLGLLGDDGRVVGNGALQDGGDGDGKMRGGGLKDPGVVAGNVAGLSEVDLLGHDGGGLVDGGDSGSLGGSGVWGGDGRGDIGSLGEGHDLTGHQTVTGGGRSDTLGGTSHNTSGGQGEASAVPKAEAAESSVSSCGPLRGSTGHSQNEGQCYERSHVAACVLLSR